MITKIADAVTADNEALALAGVMNDYKARAEALADLILEREDDVPS